jgi:hypothetical protein
MAGKGRRPGQGVNEFTRRWNRREANAASDGRIPSRQTSPGFAGILGKPESPPAELVATLWPVDGGGFERRPLERIRLHRVPSHSEADVVPVDSAGNPLPDHVLIERGDGSILFRVAPLGWGTRAHFRNLAHFVEYSNAHHAVRREHARRCLARRDAYYRDRAAGLVKVNAELEWSDQCGARAHFERELQIADLVPRIVES